MTTDRKIFIFITRRGIMAEIEYPGIATLVSRLVWEQDATGSNPVTRTTFLEKNAFLGGFLRYKFNFQSVLDHIPIMVREVKWLLQPRYGRTPKIPKSLTYP